MNKFHSKKIEEISVQNFELGFLRLIESQGNPDTDPIVLWLSGGPGSSSINSAMWMVGPFHVNKDGTTLFENVYAWNKVSFN